MPSLLIEAGPGTGKTTTISMVTTYLRATNKEAWYKFRPRITAEQQTILDWCDTHLPHDGTMIGMAYNKTAAELLNSRTHVSVQCKSIHGWGYKSVLAHCKGYIPVNESSPITIVEKITAQSFQSLPDKYDWLCAIRYSEKLKEELLSISLDNFRYLSQKYEDLSAFKASESTAIKIKQLLPFMKNPDKKRGIQYIDQVWLAHFLIKSPIYDIALIDECQDISPLRRYVCNAIAHNKIWIGDRYQAINAFAGADAKSIEKIEALDVDILPLKTSFRCPTSVINKLNLLRPLAKLRGLDKKVGFDHRIPLDKYAESVSTNDPSTTLTLSRTNAPLITAAYQLLEANIPCRILGDRAVDQLCNIVKKQNAASMPELIAKLDRYEQNITRNLDEYIAELFRDKISCIKIIINKVSSPEEVIPELKKLFKPSSSGHATLCTIHKGKGLEAENVYILFPPIESPLARTTEQKEQELNLRYVAESRTFNNTYWVV